ncbi:MAG: hypothetical protein ACM30H_04270 [Clostridia bacterium]
MKTSITLGLVFAACAASAVAAPPKVVSERTVYGFVNPESVGCDPDGKAIYVGNFGAPKLDPGKKEPTGYISKLSLDGKLVDEKYLPAKGAEPLHKPKGIWISKGKLWVTDIDSVREFDLKSRKDRKVDLPGENLFANDPAIWGNALYVTDNRNDELFKIEPADFLGAKAAPKVTKVLDHAGPNPNGVWPGKNRLLLAGFKSQDSARALWAVGKDGKAQPISLPLGRLDGLYEMADGSILATNWDDGSFFHWTLEGGTTILAKGFKGPADFCVIPGAHGKLTAYVPDLVQSQVRIIELAPAASASK